MSAVIQVAGDRVWMSTGCAEAIRLGLAEWLRAQDPAPRELERIVDALELRWPADLFDDATPYGEPDVHAVLAPAWIAIARDLASVSPRWVREVEWAQLDRGTRVWWVASLVRIVRAWTGTDLADELGASWTVAERARLRVELAETDVARAYHAWHDAPSAAGLDALTLALDAKAALAVSAGPAAVAAIDEQRERLERHIARRSAEAR